MVIMTYQFTFLQSYWNIGEKMYRKGSLQMKKTEIVWFLTKLGGGGVPQNQTISGFLLVIFLML